MCPTAKSNVFWSLHVSINLNNLMRVTIPCGAAHARNIYAKVSLKPNGCFLLSVGRQPHPSEAGAGLPVHPEAAGCSCRAVEIAIVPSIRRLQGAQRIESALVKHLGINLGQTTPDGMFTLGEMECMGACANAPMITIADYTKGVEGFKYNYYEDLTPEDTINIIETIKKGGTPKVGSQHRTKAEPAGCVANDKWMPSEGMQTLTGTPPGPYCRDLDAAT